MGNANKAVSSLQVLRPAKQGEWVPLATLGHCELVKHSQQGFEAQQYSVPRDVSLSEQEELHRYEFRCAQETNLVKVYQVERTGGGQQQGGYRVRTERIIARLAELKDLGFEQGLYILREALAGFQTIVQLKGPAVVSDRMIGVSQQGRVKVWVNENFGKSSPDQKDLKQLISETAMVDTIYQLVSRRVKNGSFPNVFRQTYEQTANRNCHSIIQMVGQFAASNNLHLPNRLNLTPLSQPKPVMANGNVPVAVSHHRNNKSQMHIVSQPVLPIHVNQSVQQTFRQPSHVVRKEVHQEVIQQQRTVVTPRVSSLQVVENKPVTPKPSPQPHFRPPTQVVTTETVTHPAHQQVVRNVVSPLPTRSVHSTEVLHTERRVVVSPRPGVTRSPVHEIIEIVNAPPPVVAVSTTVEPTTIIHTLPRVSSSQQIIPHPPVYQHHHHHQHRHIDMTNAKVTAYAETEVIGVRTKENQPHVTYVPADPQFKEGIGQIEKRDTVALPNQRAKSEYIYSIMNKPTTPAPRNNRRQRRTLHESRNRQMRGQIILHEDYDEFMGRLHRGERPKSTFVRTSMAGGRNNAVIEKRPALFAAEKIVTGETTVERSPKKKYVSADPISLGQSKNQLNKRSKNLIKFPIKKQVVVTGYERMSFESDLEPIIKQTQSSRQIKAELKVIRERSPEETPWKGMNNSQVLSLRPSVVANPEVPVHFGFQHNKAPNLSTSNVQISYQGQQSHSVHQSRVSPQPIKVETVVQEVHHVPHVQVVQQVHHAPHLVQEVHHHPSHIVQEVHHHPSQIVQEVHHHPSHIVQEVHTHPSQIIKEVHHHPSHIVQEVHTHPSQIVKEVHHQVPHIEFVHHAQAPQVHVVQQPSHVHVVEQVQQQVHQAQHVSQVHQPSPLHREAQEQPMLRYSPPKKDTYQSVDFQHPIPAPSESIQSSESILKIIEESRRYRMGAAASLDQVLKGTSTEVVPSFNYQSPILSSNLRRSNQEASYTQYNQVRAQPTTTMTYTSFEEDITSLRPETLFEPKPPSRKEQIYQTVETTDYRYSQPLTQAFGRVENTDVSGGYSGALAANTNYQSELFHSFGNTRTMGYEQYEYEQQVVSYGTGPQQVNYYRRDYQQVEYGNASSSVPSEILYIDRPDVAPSAHFPKLKGLLASKQ